MKRKAREIIALLICIAVIAISFTVVAFKFHGNKETNVRLEGTISNLQRQNRELENALVQAQGTIGGVADSIKESSGRVGLIYTGLGDGLDSIDGIIAIAEELGSLISGIEETIRRYDERTSSGID